jgi:uncharacterized repeat protein (TIGR01451 family)
VDAGFVANTATAAGTDPNGDPVSDTDDEQVDANQAPSIQIVKTASPQTYSASGDVIGYSFAVTNTGNVTLSNVSVTDPLPGLSAIDCSPEGNPIADMVPAELVTCTASYTITQADVDAGFVANMWMPASWPTRRRRRVRIRTVIR